MADQNYSIIPFNFEAREIRTITDEQGAPWFVLKDVLENMGTTTTTTQALNHIFQGLGDGYNNVIPIVDALGRDQQVYIIAEPAMTYLTARSNSAQGRKLNRWLHIEVLPTLRKAGHYGAVDPLLLERLDRLEALILQQQSQPQPKRRKAPPPKRLPYPNFDAEFQLVEQYAQQHARIICAEVKQSLQLRATVSRIGRWLRQLGFYCQSLKVNGCSTRIWQLMA